MFITSKQLAILRANFKLVLTGLLNPRDIFFQIDHNLSKSRMSFHEMSNKNTLESANL